MLDGSGAILYPIKINNSLKILDLGQIVADRPLFHSEKNFFPVGFKTTRKHIHFEDPSKHANYLCEILDGDSKP